MAGQEAKAGERPVIGRFLARPFWVYRGSNIRAVPCYGVTEIAMSLVRLAANQATVDGDHSAGHVIRKVGREKLDHLDAVLDRTEPP